MHCINTASISGTVAKKNLEKYGKMFRPNIVRHTNLGLPSHAPDKCRS